jgi:hypothetical protein
LIWNCQCNKKTDKVKRLRCHTVKVIKYWMHWAAYFPLQIEKAPLSDNASQVGYHFRQVVLCGSPTKGTQRTHRNDCYIHTWTDGQAKRLTVGLACIRIHKSKGSGISGPHMQHLPGFPALFWWGQQQQKKLAMRHKKNHTSKWLLDDSINEPFSILVHIWWFFGDSTIIPSN